MLGVMTIRQFALHSALFLLTRLALAGSTVDVKTIGKHSTGCAVVLEWSFSDSSTSYCSYNIM